LPDQDSCPETPGFDIYAIGQSYRVMNRWATAWLKAAASTGREPSGTPSVTSKRF